MSLGGGGLQHFGLNSNTSARGFLKCAFKKRAITNNQSSNNDTGGNSADNSPSKNFPKKASAAETKKKSEKRDNEEQEESEEELAEDSERGGDCDEAEEEQPQQSKQWETVPLNCFKDLYKVSPIYKAMADYGSLIVPLAVVGMYLNYCGNHLLHYVATVMRRRIFYPSHRVTSIVLL